MRRCTGGRTTATALRSTVAAEAVAAVAAAVEALQRRSMPHQLRSCQQYAVKGSPSYSTLAQSATASRLPPACFAAGRPAAPAAGP